MSHTDLSFTTVEGNNAFPSFGLLLRYGVYFAASLFVLLLMSTVPAAAQDQDSTKAFEEGYDVPDSLFTVEGVVLSGNNATKEQVILREMELKPGVSITGDAMRYDQARIYSLGLFQRVQMRIAPTGPGKANVYVNVVERWYIVPYPIFGLKDGDWKKFYFGAGLVHANFRGMNEKLGVSMAFGYDPWGSLSYRSPFLDSAGTYFFEGRIGFSRVRNRSTQVLLRPDDAFDEQHFVVGATLGKRLNNYNTAWIGVEYQTVAIPDYPPAPTVSTDGTDRFPTLTIGYAYDTRNTAEYASAGTFFRTSATKYGIPGNTLDFIRYAVDVRQFVPLAPSWSFGARAATNLIAGSAAPPYNHVYVGSEYRVRGHYTELYEGENLFGATAEIHFTLLPVFYWQFKQLPAQFSVGRFGITLAAFADAGIPWYRGQAVSTANSWRGIGGGIHFMLPYGVILRTEYAVNESHGKQFTVDLGAAF